MTKFKLLNLALKIFISVLLLGIACQIAILFLLDSEMLEKINSKVPGSMYSVILLTTLLAIGLVQVQLSFTSFGRLGYFNLKSSGYLKSGGLTLIFFSLASSVYNLFIISYLSTESILLNFIMYSIILLIGVGLMAVADILAKGEIIERENSLTI